MAQGTVKVVRRRHGVRFQRPGRRTTGVFVHHSAIQADGYRSLQENQRVKSRRNPVAAGRPGSIPWRYVLMSDLPGVPLKIVRDQLSAADRQAGWPAGRDHRGAP
jgi:cold shock protein